MNHDNIGLFNNISKATVPIIDTLNAQEVSNTVNAFAKINHDNSVLFNNVTIATIPIVGTFNAQDIANTVIFLPK